MADEDTNEFVSTPASGQLVSFVPPKDTNSTLVVEEDASDEVTLTLEGPFYVHAFTGESASGDKLTVDRAGIRVSVADAEELVKQAVLSGVALKIGE